MSDVIMNELCAATRTSQNEGEDRQIFLTRLIKLLIELPDSEWALLKEPAQEWTNNAIAEINKDSTITEIPGSEEPEPEPEPEPPRRPQLGRRLGSAVPPVEPQAPSTKPPEVEKPTQPTEPTQSNQETAKKSRPSVNKRIRAIMIQNPSLSFDDLLKQLREEGFNSATGGTIWSGFKSASIFIKELRAQGQLK